VGRHNDGGQGRVRGGRVQFVDARELQERMQQQVRRGVQRVRGRGQEWTVGRRPRVQARGGCLGEGGALFGLTVRGMKGRGRMVKVKIGRGAVAVAHKLVRAMVALAEGPGGCYARGCLAARQGGARRGKRESRVKR
jgi:hypothetical protein